MDIVEVFVVVKTDVVILLLKTLLRIVIDSIQNAHYNKINIICRILCVIT